MRRNDSQNTESVVKRANTFCYVPLICFFFLIPKVGKTQLCVVPYHTVGITPTNTLQATPVYTSGSVSFTFYAVQGCNYWFSTCGQASTNTFLSLHGQYGITVTNANNTCGSQETLTWTCTSSAIYTLQLAELNSGCVQLSANTSMSYSSSCALSNCAGLPPPSTIAISSPSGCPSVNLTFSASGTPTTYGNSFQWQSASTPTGVFGTVPNNWNTSYQTPTSTTTYFRLLTTCLSSGQTATSNVVTYSVVNPGACYCKGYPLSYASYTGGENIVSVKLGSMTNTSSCQSQYTNFSGSVSPVDICRGGSTSFSVTMADCGFWQGVQFAIYVDYNHDGQFIQTNELVYSDVSNYTTPNTYTGSISVPSTASIGITRLRIVARGGFGGIPAPSGQYFATGETEDYCVFIHGPPTVTANSGAVCPGMPFVITPTGGVSYTFTSPSGTLTGPSATVYPYSSTTFTIRGMDALGCTQAGTNYAVATVTTLLAPNLLVTSSPTALCIGSTATVSASGASSYTWISPASNSPSIVVSPTAMTIYTVFGTASLPCNGAKQFSLLVNPLPTISAIPASTTACAQSTITYSALGAVTYTWNSNSYGSPIILNTPTSNSVFIVAGTSSLGCVSTATLPITVNPLPSISISPPAPTVCAQSSLSLSAGGADTYTWSTGSQSSSIAVTVPATTNFIVSGNNSLNCTASQTAVVQTNTLPTISVNPFSLTICQNYSTSLTASGAATYTWNTGVQAPVLTLTPTGNMTLFVSGTNLAGCVSSATVPVITYPSPTVMVVPPSPTVCSSSSILLNASGAGTYTWNNGSNASVISLTPTITTSLTVTGTGLKGCTASKSVVVSVYPSSLSVYPTSTTICAGQTATFSATGGITYTWFPSFTNGSEFATDSASANYSVSGTDEHGCIYSNPFSLYVDNCLQVTSFTGGNALRLFPNPCNGILTMSTDLQGTKNIELWNCLGKHVASFSTDDDQPSLDLTVLPPGLYLIHAGAGGRLLVGKIVKE